MKKLSDKEILEAYNLLKVYWEKYLKSSGVKMPNLKNKNDEYTHAILALICLAHNYPNTNTTSKDELTSFIRYYHPKTNDAQEGRHLGMQYGWFVSTGTRGEITGEKIPGGSYKLVTLEKPHPSYFGNRKTGVKTSDFEELKKEYGYRCAVCGSKEGEAHRIRKNCIVKLQEGHIDPTKDLISGNIIPQCQICNRPDRNRWIYDKNGRVTKVAPTEDGRRVVEDFLEKSDKETLKALRAYIDKLL